MKKQNIYSKTGVRENERGAKIRGAKIKGTKFKGAWILMGIRYIAFIKPLQLVSWYAYDKK